MAESRPAAMITARQEVGFRIIANIVRQARESADGGALQDAPLTGTGLRMFATDLEALAIAVREHADTMYPLPDRLED